MPSSKSIGLLGGTFNPVHKGHVSIVKSFLESSYIDEIWILLTPSPPHKKQDNLITYHERLKMLKRAFSEMDNVSVSDIETKLSKPSYTVQTVEFFKKKYPDINFFICMGEDSLVHFESWYRWEDIIRQCHLLVASRPEFNFNNGEEKLKNAATFIPHKPVHISSSKLRKKICNGESIDQWVPEPVTRYIKDNNLYAKNC